MVDVSIKIDTELKKFLDGKKLIDRETYKSVIKRLIKFPKRKKAKNGRI